jgi:N-acetylmuramoyl-L-alanine amidase
MSVSRHSLSASLLAVAIAFLVSLEPVLHAARVQDRELSLAERIFATATADEARLKETPFEQRDPGAYPRLIDLYRQVADAAAGTDLVDLARVRMADLTREMALRTGDAAQFENAVEIYRKLVTTRPDSPHIGAALVDIAQIYRYDLQDVDLAAAAYRDIVLRFPNTVASREADANIARLDTTSGGAGETSVVGAIVAPTAEVAMAASEDGVAPARILNVRSFAGPNYARIVVDLNRSISYRETREGTRLVYKLSGVELSDALLGRRLATPRGSIIEGMRVEQLGDGVRISVDLTTLGSASAFTSDDPVRLVIDMRGAGMRDTAPVKLDLVGSAGVASIGDLAKLAPEIVPEDIAPPPPLPGPEVAPAPSALSAPRPIRCIVLDPGHGGQDTGTIGPGGLAEKNVTLDIARRLRAALQAELPGVEIVLTRDGDRFISLDERTAVANARNADLFVSIHANASQSSNASGIETYVQDPEALKEPQNKKRGDQVYASVSFASQISASRSLAGFVQGSLVRGVSARNPNSAKDRGIKHASFAVLRGAHMPAILAEVSFVSNPEDENLLRTPGFRQRIANSLVAGIRGYVRSANR